MQIHLVLPGLVWPSAQAPSPAAGLALPGLSALLGHAAVELAAPTTFESWLGRAFGLPDDAPLPLAAARRLGEEAAPPEPAAEWLCADPTHLHFAREHLLLTDASDLEITAEEAAALVAALNENFAELGCFEAGTPERWYLRLSAPSRAQFFPLNDVVGRPVAHFLPEGEAGRAWQRAINEAQVVLHNHPVNQAREAAGKRAVNSVWPWGAGALPDRLAPPQPAVQAEGALARGLARAAGVEPTAPAAAAATAGNTLVVLEALLAPALHLDLDAWRAALVGLERDWFAPLHDALRAGRLARLALSAPGDRATLELSVNGRRLWRFWRRPLALDTVAARIPAPVRPSLPEQ